MAASHFVEVTDEDSFKKLIVLTKMHIFQAQARRIEVNKNVDVVSV